MTTFDDREKAFEHTHTREEMQNFRIGVRLAKLFGLWAAEQLGIEEQNREAYANEIVSANVKDPRFNDVFERVEKEFAAKGMTITKAKMRAVLRKSLREARKRRPGTSA